MSDCAPSSASSRRIPMYAAAAAALVLAACGGPQGEAGAAEASDGAAAPAERVGEAPASEGPEDHAPSQQPAADQETSDRSPPREETSRARPEPKRTSPPETAAGREPAGQPSSDDAEGETAPQDTTPSAAPEARLVKVEAGTTLQAELGQEISTRKNDPGDPFTATLAAPVVQGRQVVVPEGAVLRGEVTASEKSSKPGDPAALTLHFSAIEFDGERYPLTVTVTEVQPRMEKRASTKKNAARVGGAAAGGAVLGKILGDGAKSTIIGGVAGAATGTAIIMATKDADAVLPAGSPVTLRLDEPLLVSADAR